MGLGAGMGLVGTWMSPALVWLACTGLIGWSLVRRRRMFQWLREAEEGVAFMAAGEYDRAAAVFDPLCRRSRRTPTLHSLFVYNRSVLALETGRLESAVEGLRAVVEAGWIRERGTLAIYYPALLGKLALGEALLGQLTAAETWQRRAHRACIPAKSGSLLLVDAVIAARRGNHDALLEHIQTEWTRAENMMTIQQLRTVRLLEAFALAQLQGGEYRRPSRDDELLRALARAREAPVGSYDYLATAWPAMREFLEHHGLANA